jgi:hypothetical protein
VYIYTVSFFPQADLRLDRKKGQLT